MAILYLYPMQCAYYHDLTLYTIIHYFSLSLIFSRLKKCIRTSLYYIILYYIISQSAYFVISEDAKHGENLVCSYFACRNGGIKFRYCAHCMAPVAKRNFSRRHDHGMSKNKDGGIMNINSFRDDDDYDDEDTLGGESEHTAGNAAAAAAAGEGGGGGEEEGDGSNAKKPNASSSSGEGSKRKRDDSGASYANGDSNNGSHDNDEATSVSSKRQAMWSSLLTKRPRTKDPRNLSSWLNEVLAVSDMDFPLDRVGTDLNHSLGSTLLNHLPKLSQSAATPTEDEAGDSSTARDMDATTTSISSARTYDAETVLGSNKEKAATSSSSPTKTTKKKKMKDKKAKGEKEKFASTDKSSKSVAAKSSSSSTKKDPMSPSKMSPSSKKSSGKKSKMSPSKRSTGDNKKLRPGPDDDGFSGGFADWRDRKKQKTLKKGPVKLKK
ncbi:MAG: hypothetical protein ACI8RD_012711 [Bacillariaceae sp.]|jgi:hypothetical protein